MSSEPYPYPVKNSDLIKHHNLEKHFEGGYFAQTVALPSHKPTTPNWPENLPKSTELQAKGREQVPYGPGTGLLGGEHMTEPALGSEPALDATIIFYLLTSESYRGKMHMNLHSVSDFSFARDGTPIVIVLAKTIAFPYPPRGKSFIHLDQTWH